MPKILATQQAEIRGSQFHASLGKKSVRSYLNQKSGCSGSHLYLGGIGRRLSVQGQSQAKCARPYPKTKAEKDWGHYTRPQVQIPVLLKKEVLNS
jgi:hypothetical protein